jgi:nucleotide-binding universal stress UspA family protein
VFKHIVIPTDGSDLSKDAVQYGVSLAKAVNAMVTGDHGFDALSYLCSRSGNAHRHPRIVETTNDSHCGEVPRTGNGRNERSRKCDTVHVENGHPFQAIIDVAKTKGCDLIVMASQGRSGIDAIVLGGETRESPPKLL